MVFKRRDKRPISKIVLQLIWPKGGWTRSFHYIRHRLNRLPDTPEKIARGIWAGVFTTFTPFYGLHFFIAVGLARAMKGNIIASLLATFFGNPLTYIPIGVISLKTGYFLLGTKFHEYQERSFIGKFVDAGYDLKHNFMTLFSGGDVDWSNFWIFYDEILFPYMIGGIVPGIIAATTCYILTVPLIRAYQNRRSGALKARLLKLKRNKSVGRKPPL